MLDDVLSGYAIVVFTDELGILTLRANDANRVVHGRGCFI
jgi:hypothetical protein